MFKVNNGNTRTICDVPVDTQRIFIVYKTLSLNVYKTLLTLSSSLFMLPLNLLHTNLWLFHCWFWLIIHQLDNHHSRALGIQILIRSQWGMQPRLAGHCLTINLTKFLQRKMCQNTGFLWPVSFRKRKTNAINSVLTRKIPIRENTHTGIFYAVITLLGQKHKIMFGRIVS